MSKKSTNWVVYRLGLRTLCTPVQDVPCIRIMLDSKTPKFAQVEYMQAWAEDPLDTLKLIAHLRDVRDGKAEQKAFRLCVRWLYEKHPSTLVENLLEVVQVCCVVAACCA